MYILYEMYILPQQSQNILDVGLDSLSYQYLQRGQAVLCIEKKLAVPEQYNLSS